MLQGDPPQNTGAVFVGLTEEAKLIRTPYWHGIDAKSCSHGTAATHLPASSSGQGGAVGDEPERVVLCVESR